MIQQRKKKQTSVEQRLSRFESTALDFDLEFNCRLV
jgi:hypothetical protein